MAANAHAAPVVVELFTSQGCSSCPDADRLFSTWGKAGFERGQLIPLSFDVDYWDYLGWKDVFATPEYSRRQRAYSRTLGVGVYTPQMVVGGRTAFVGSDAARAEGEAARRRGAASAASVRVTAEPSTRVHLRVDVQAPAERRASRVMLALFETDLRTPVTAGENDGRTLTNDFVVRRLLDLGPLPADGKPFHRLVDDPWRAGWDKARSGATVFLQDPATMAIDGAASVFPLQ